MNALMDAAGNLRTPYTVLRPGEQPRDDHMMLPERPTYMELLNRLRHLFDGKAFDHWPIMLEDGNRGDIFLQYNARPSWPINYVATEHLQRGKVASGVDAKTLAKAHGPAVVFYRRVWY